METLFRIGVIVHQHQVSRAAWAGTAARPERRAGCAEVADDPHRRLSPGKQVRLPGRGCTGLAVIFTRFCYYVCLTALK